MLERQSEAATLNLYKLSTYFNILSKSDKVTSFQFIQQWQAWLNTPGVGGSQNDTDFLHIAVDVLFQSIATLGVDESLLSTRFNKCISTEHRCVVNQILNAMAETDLHRITTSHLKNSTMKENVSRKLCNSCSAEECCQKMRSASPSVSSDVQTRSACCAENGDLQRISCGFFGTMLLLSWPYELEDGTNGWRIKKYVGDVMKETCQPLQFEVMRLRTQLESVFGIEPSLKKTR